jgi:hypothetical protein
MIPAPFYALLSGTGFGALGAGIIALAIAWVRRIEPLAGIAGEAVPDSERRLPASRDADGDRESGR